MGYAPSLTGAPMWRDLTGAVTPGCPRNACRGAEKPAGGRVYVKVLTTAGRPWLGCPAPE
ncbi:hypothetical protein ACFVX6_33025 [Streptomyces sp. NPDC058289]|uniref:hypothetical protein n=1 Tax=Streptomyces sp. NPDC058289 TaxID=3346425 RepID=UPI0036E13FF2